VDILAAYSNRADLLVDLRETARRLGWSAGADEADEPRSVRTLAPGFRTRQVVHRLGETALSEIVARFEEGTPKHRLAAEYEISLSTVKRLLRKRHQREASGEVTSEAAS